MFTTGRPYTRQSCPARTDPLERRNEVSEARRCYIARRCANIARIEPLLARLYNEHHTSADCTASLALLLHRSIVDAAAVGEPSPRPDEWAPDAGMVSDGQSDPRHIG